MKSYQTSFAQSLAAWGLAALAMLGLWKSSTPPPDYGVSVEPVGPFQPGDAPRHVTPDNHVLTPLGIQVELPGLRPNAVALSPNGRLLVAAGTAARLVCVDPGTGRILQEVALPAEDQAAPASASENILQPDKSAKLSFTGLVFSPNGERLYLSNVNGSIKVFAVREDGTVAPSFTIPLPPAEAPRRKAEIPSGLTVSPDGSRLYVALNLSNRVAEIDTASGKTLRVLDAGVAPYDVALAAGKLYVSNWGGRRPQPGDAVAQAGRGMEVRIDPETTVAKEGSISIFDLASGRLLKEIATGRHASALAVHPAGSHVACACAADDFVTVVSTATDAVVEKIWPKRTPADLFGASPTALVFSADGRELYVCNGTQNAVTIVDFEPGRSELEGLLPTAWYPGGIVFDQKRRRLAVANMKGLGSWKRIPEGEPRAFISGAQFGTLSIMDLPASKEDLASHTQTVLRNARGPALRTALLRPRSGRKPVPVPERHGEPSVFKHVLYVIKENRTYDQVLGDMPEGNGDPSLCIFGERVTPNQHKLCRDFVLLDNTYCSGVLSADGHNWSCSAITTDYLERSFSGWPRSYPDGSEPANADSLAWAPTGFIWDQALKAGRSVRIYGEFGDIRLHWADPARKERPQWSDIWQDYLSGAGEIVTGSAATLATLRSINCEHFAAWEKGIPDQVRTAAFLKELKEWEATGQMPNLMIMSLPIDHTSATLPGFPTPAAQVADNDLAFGKIVEAVSRSRFWKDTCILAIEDDPQNGWDHVSAYRTTAYVASPWTKRGSVIRTQYNQTSILRTIELILGLKPMHELDAIATPLFDCFTDTPDFTPWQAVPNRHPLDEMNPPLAEITDPVNRQDAIVSMSLPLHKLDACPEDVLNRILWRSVRRSEAYPEWAAGRAEQEDEEEEEEEQ